MTKSMKTTRDISMTKRMKTTFLYEGEFVVNKATEEEIGLSAMNWHNRTFFGQGERGSIFRDFVRTFFMDGPKSFFTLHMVPVVFILILSDI